MGELMSIVRKVEWWSPRLATSLVLIIVIMVIGDYDDGDADDYDDAVVASQINGRGLVDDDADGDDH